MNLIQYNAAKKIIKIFAKLLPIWMFIRVLTHNVYSCLNYAPPYNMLPIHFMRVIIHFDTTVNIKAFVLKIVVK